ncbi:hypothetical protein Tco_0804661 [Tanacetum coccineum]|uniref:Uncharacterized protein n=1 Tax=Tanacetum coccineum TaxID=301880 RepID=A0ABQ5A6N6_9ASTR
MEELTAKLDEHLAALNIDLDMELFPHMLTTITGRRWVIGYGFRLADGLEAGIERGKAGKILENVESYDAEVEAKYLAVVKDLEDIPFPLLEDLKALKDSLIELL